MFIRKKKVINEIKTMQRELRKQIEAWQNANADDKEKRISFLLVELKD